jgi:ABC-type uncharacterized transport system substrate-binding protein
VNTEVAQNLGITVPEELLGTASEVFSEIAE